MKKQVIFVPLKFTPKDTNNPRYITVGSWSVRYDNKELFRAYMYADGGYFLINTKKERVFLGRNDSYVWSLSTYLHESVTSIAWDVVNRLNLDK